MGQLIPIGVVEALPGDTIQHNTNVLVRVSPLAAPVMHPVTARVEHFFVPNRLLWSGWEDFITGGPDGTTVTPIPTIPTNAASNDLMDHFGIPPVANIDVNILPIKAFNQVYNEFYRDQDTVPLRNESDLTIPQIAWEKDYFTTARPWTQKGPDVTIPLGDTAPVMPTGNMEPLFTDGSGNVGPFQLEGNPQNVNHNVGNPGNDQCLWSDPKLEADLSAAIGANVNDVRKAFAIQRYQEARARYGSRYTEYLRHLGVTPSDARLQRPEFLGGGRTQINFSEVLQTAPETGQQPSTEFGVGDLYGHGIAAMRSNKYRRFIEEHGYIISMFSVRPKAIYTNGINRIWLRRDKEDFFQKELQWIGQQEIFNNEVYASETEGTEVFGYQDRYMEYRYQPSQVSAEFRNILNYWHLGREFADTPTLNQSFTDCVPSKRIHNEQTQHALWIMAQHKMVARRLLDRNASPRIF